MPVVPDRAKERQERIDSELSKVKKLASTAKTHAAEARGHFARGKKDMDDFDKAQTAAVLSIAESFAALMCFIIVAIEEDMT